MPSPSRPSRHPPDDFQEGATRHGITAFQSDIKHTSTTGRSKESTRTWPGTAYTSIRAALLDRLAALDAQKDIALATDVDA
jgi:hypothetical protein